MSSITQYLDAVTGMKYKIFMPHFLKAHGQFYVKHRPAPMLMEKNACYMNTLRMMWEDPDNGYCEGLAYKPGLIPLNHAWSVNPAGEITDWTWAAEEGVEYFGVQFSNAFMMEMTERTSYPSVFESLYMLRMGFDDVWAYLEKGLVKK